MVTCITRMCENPTSYTIIVPSKPNQKGLGVRVTAATTATRFRPKHCVSVNLSESIEGWPQHEDSINFFAKWLVWLFVIDSLIFGMIQVFPTVNHSMHFACHLQLQRSRLLSLTDHTSSMHQCVWQETNHLWTWCLGEIKGSIKQFCGWARCTLLLQNQLQSLHHVLDEWHQWVLPSTVKWVLNVFSSLSNTILYSWNALYSFTKNTCGKKLTKNCFEAK